MLHACFHTIYLMFRYTSWHFYAFSGTNLLTSCHSVSSLFSAVFVFQKWYTGNILGIGQNKFLKSYFSQKLPVIRRGEGEGPQAALTPGWRDPGPGRAALVWGGLGPPLTLPWRRGDDGARKLDRQSWWSKMTGQLVNPKIRFWWI
jgi:hypothetical protein